MYSHKPPGIVRPEAVGRTIPSYSSGVTAPGDFRVKSGTQGFDTFSACIGRQQIHIYQEC